MRIMFVIICLLMASSAKAQNIEQIGPDLSHPWGIDFVADNIVIVTERNGRMKRINITTGDTVDIKGLPDVFARKQGGLLDVISHDGLLYFCFSRRVEGGSATTLMRARLVDDRLTEKVLMFTSNTPQKGGHHFGCRMAIQDGSIFLSIGDRGKRDDAQVMTSHSGAVIRLPLKGGDADIFTKGHRNPQGMAIHPESMAIWVNEHGPKGGDEINILAQGNNYGWPIVSHGREYYGGKVGDGITSAPGYADPVWVWVPSIAPSGMAFYKGDMFPSFKGDLLVTSLKFRSLYHVEIENGLPVRETPLLKGIIGRIRDVEIAPDGSILLLSDEASGGLYRLFQ